MKPAVLAAFLGIVIEKRTSGFDTELIELEGKGVVVKDASSPTEYKLTPKGENLLKVLSAACDFFESHDTIKKDASDLWSKAKNEYNKVLENLKME